MRSKRAHLLLFFFDSCQHFVNVINEFEPVDNIEPDKEMNAETIDRSFLDLEELFLVFEIKRDVSSRSIWAYNFHFHDLNFRFWG